ncbi:SLC13 family permease [Gordonia sp. NPDC058843]|uniref:SLC13 family permease n=1 Tax=Gordonia sp. NPDC058843 TaxID=3346648 RepID=UPI00368DCEAF
MSVQLTALLIFMAVFIIAGWRKIHAGAVALVGASIAGIFVADLSAKEVLAGFPVNLLILLAGVTFLFGLAQVNGTIDAIIDRSVSRFHGKAYLMPLVFVGLSAMISAMAATAAIAIIPIAMQIARRYRIDPMLMSVSVGAGLTVGMFAPFGLFGLITAGVAEEAGIALNGLVLFAIAIVVNSVLVVAAYILYGGRDLYRERASVPEEDGEPSLVGAAPLGTVVGNEQPVREVRTAPSGSREGRAPFTAMQKLTLGAIGVFAVSVIVIEALDMTVDIGLTCFAFAVLLLVIDPTPNREALAKIDWSTILLVGGIITFVSVLQTVGATELLSEAAAAIGWPLLSAFILCVVGGLVSAFASTTGTLAAIVPLAVPLAATGELAGWAVIASLALCSALADVAPFSTVGATMVSTAPSWPGKSIHTRLFAWGAAMVVVGPVLFTIFLLLPTSL